VTDSLITGVRQLSFAALLPLLQVGLDVREYVHCSACQLTTHSSRYTQYFYNTQARAGLSALSRSLGGSSGPPDEVYELPPLTPWSSKASSRKTHSRQQPCLGLPGLVVVAGGSRFALYTIPG
jgi:hypothetical protein